MHPLGVSHDDYMTALKINQLQNLQEKAIGIKEWEKATGHKFPWGFPNIDSFLPEGDDWTKVVTDPASYAKGGIF